MEAEPEKKRPEPHIILIEGNVGSGKTKFIGHFENIPGVQLKYEPIDRWTNYMGENLLDLMYSDGKNYLLFQLFAYLTQLQGQLNSDQPVLIMERSLHSARFVFVEHMRNDPNQKLACKLLTEWYDFLMEQLESKLKTGTIIYLRTSPQIAMARTQGRGRLEEENLNLDFFTKIHNWHEKWLIQKIWGTAAAPNVVVLSGDKNYQDMLQEINLVKEIITQHTKFPAKTKIPSLQDGVPKTDDTFPISGSNFGGYGPGGLNRGSRGGRGNH